MCRRQRIFCCKNFLVHDFGRSIISKSTLLLVLISFPFTKIFTRCHCRCCSSSSIFRSNSILLTCWISRRGIDSLLTKRQFQTSIPCWNRYSTKKWIPDYCSNVLPVLMLVSYLPKQLIDSDTVMPEVHFFITSLFPFLHHHTVAVLFYFVIRCIDPFQSKIM